MVGGDDEVLPYCKNDTRVQDKFRGSKGKSNSLEDEGGG